MNEWTDSLDLSGIWHCAADKTNVEAGIHGWPVNGIPEKARIPLTRREQPNWIELPGTTDDARIGYAFQPGCELSTGLDRAYSYDGDIWFEKEIMVPASFAGKKVTLSLERTFWHSRVWVDGISLGEDKSCATPHRYDASELLVPGRNRITILVNAQKPAGFWGHHFTPGSGAGWNGIIGGIRLEARDFVSIADVQCYPDPEKGLVMIQTRILNGIGSSTPIRMEWSVRSRQASNQKECCESGISEIVAGRSRMDLVAESGEHVLETIIPLAPARLWDEFEPNLYTVEVKLSSVEHKDERTAVFGLRVVKSDESGLYLNGRRIFLRGTHEGCQFPKHGHPPMDAGTWERYLTTAREYGMNHIRFHSWCPPEAAFQAADKLGLYLQVEMSGGHATELPRILNAYGNHPSFLLLTLGNELFNHNEGDGGIEEYLPQRWGEFDTLQTLSPKNLIVMAQKYDPRHLYSCTSHPVSESPCVDDFHVSAWGRNRMPTVGIQWGGGDVQHTSRFNSHPPETGSDYRQAIKGLNRPLVSHEVGQWTVFPDLSETHRFTGVLRNHNYDLFREHLREKGMLEQAADFTQASGRLSVELYKEEIESALRTPGFGGFQLLDLHDYQGQGVATVGILNAFWESKGLIDAARFREFCGPIVPLVRMPKRIYLQSERLVIPMDVANYSQRILKDIRLKWQITDTSGTLLHEGRMQSPDAAPGELTCLGTLNVDLSGMNEAKQCTLVVSLDEGIRNRWNFWVYPESYDLSLPEGVRIFHGWSEDVLHALDSGERVLLFPAGHALSDARPGCFTNEFWTPFCKPVPPARTMGLLIQHEHPLFSRFPTRNHSDWQWQDLIMNSSAMVLDDALYTLRPLVQVIDNFDSMEKLGSLYECRMGSGKLMVCAFDLTTGIQNRPAARQFTEALYRYLESDAFNPRTELTSQMIEKTAGRREGRNAQYGSKG